MTSTSSPNPIIIDPQIDNPVWSSVGNTPLLDLTDILPVHSDAIKILGKAEWYNPGGSVKDRPAKRILEIALKEDKLAKGRTFLDSTSGNMGIAYATLGAAMGIPVHLVIPENAGPERMGILRAHAAVLTLSDPLEGSDGAHELAVSMASEHPDRYFYADQYSNPANWEAHYAGTGPELWRQTKGGLTHFIAGMGTTGTITGVGKFLKEQNPDIRVLGVQPNGPLHGLEGLKHLATSPTPPIFDETLLDEIIPISTEETYQLLRDLARKKGFFLGVSAGAALVAAVKLSTRVNTAVLGVILPDSGIKYVSLPFWSEP
jgi:cysteine synthase B